MKTIIHIGQHKTGTTSIQKFLQDNTDHLVSQGLYVPAKIAGYEHPSHFILNVYSLAENRYSSKKEELIKERGNVYLKHLETELKEDIQNIYKDAIRNKCNKVVWSNEGLYLLNTVDEYKRLISLFSKYSTEVEVVCCFRDVDSYRNSYMKQLHKQGIPESNNPNSYRYLAKNSWLFDYESKKRLLKIVFDKCTFFEYDSNDNIREFMRIIGANFTDSLSYRFNVTLKN